MPLSIPVSIPERAQLAQSFGRMRNPQLLPGRMATATNASARVAGQLLSIPFAVYGQEKYDQLAMRVITGVAGGLYQFGIYAGRSPDGLPGDAIVRSAEFSGAASNVESILPLNNFVLNRGVYHFVVLCNAALVFRGFASADQEQIFGPSSTNASAGVNRFERTFAYAPLPSNFGTSGLVQASGILGNPGFYVRDA